VRSVVARRPTGAAAGSVDAPTDDLPADAPTIVVVGLGPGDPKQLTLEAFDALTAPGAKAGRLLRTRTRPTLSLLLRAYV